MRQRPPSQQPRSIHQRILCVRQAESSRVPLAPEEGPQQDIMSRHEHASVGSLNLGSESGLGRLVQRVWPVIIGDDHV